MIEIVILNYNTIFCHTLNILNVGIIICAKVPFAAYAETCIFFD